ncbi:MAG: Holliday junction resolvase RuvX [Minisyncoccia bacterium]
MRYLGIDYGSKKIGIALSDENGTMGFPHGILENAPPLLPTILTLIEKERVGAVVIGESKDFAGGDNPIAKDARAFGGRIAEQSGLPVFFEDERLTSAEARRQFDTTEKTRAPKSRANVDASAAALILTNFLSKPNHG